jgi:hypothetical protein
LPTSPHTSSNRPSDGRPPGQSSRPAGQRPATRPTRRARPPIRRSFAERNRSRLIWLGVLVVALAFGGVVYLNVTAPAYACSVQWMAPPTSSPAPSSTPQLGFAQPDMGRNHVPPGTVVKYLYCPPASGNHYAQIPQGPIPVKVYGPNDKAIPEGWVHNMEHGGLVLLYNCSGPSAGDGCTDAGQAKLKQLFTQWPASPICQSAAGVVGPVMARFDNMAYPYAALVWDQVLPLQTLDTKQILTFFQQKAERVNPEKQCGEPSAAPGASESATPSTLPSQAPASTAPSTIPSTAPTASPAPAAS